MLTNAEGSHQSSQRDRRFLGRHDGRLLLHQVVSKISQSIANTIVQGKLEHHLPRQRFCDGHLTSSVDHTVRLWQ